ncbi:MAG: hypothetical protein PF961_18330 [Planctomycetota bacterium]|jgi:hypothetical protein|nr:hypothetical protein [Planctomycetota bacterium]
MSEPEAITALVTAAKDAGLVVSGVISIGTGSPQRTAILLDEIDIEAVRKLAQMGAKLAKKGLAAPWLLTHAVIAGSLDTFPLELLELRIAGHVVHGSGLSDDLAEPLAEHLRLQIERELRAAAITLRQNLLQAGDAERSCNAIVAEARVGLARVMRGLVYLNKPDAAGDPNAWPEACDPEVQPLARDLATAPAPGWAGYRALYQAVTAAAQAVDSDA